VKVVNPDAAKPAVDLEQQAVVAGLMGLLLGDQVGGYVGGGGNWAWRWGWWWVWGGGVSGERGEGVQGAGGRGARGVWWCDCQ
jgi:hypothetical protein